MKSKILAITTVLFLIAAPSPARYSGGTGEPNDPYRIATRADIQEMRDNPADWDKHFILTADIDLGQTTYTTAVVAPDTSGDSGFQGTAFTGTFDGNGHRIINVTIDTGGLDSDYLGLFGMIGSGGQVKNLGLEDVTVTGGDYSNSLGGLAGGNWGTISNCYSTGAVTGGHDSECLGGLVGENYYEGTIANSYSTGRVDAEDRSFSVGGLAGYNSGTITNCYSMASVTGGDGLHFAGGLVADNRGSISNSYSTGAVTAGNFSRGLGGLVGSGGAVGNSFWDIETSNQSTSAGGTGKTTAQMQMATTFLGWNGCGQVIWTIDESNDYPRLFWEDKPGEPLPTEQLSDFITGAGTESEPYLIYTAEELNMIGLFTCAWDKHFKLMADIDLGGFGGTEFNIIGRGTGFAGTFDGNSRRIINLTIDTGGLDSDYLGLFGMIGSGGQVKNLGLENVTVTGGSGSDYVGGLVGKNSGTITNCYSTGSVTGSWHVGGLVGYNNGGTISNCYSTASVTGSWDVGGLVGENWYGSINNCYSTGEVSGGNHSSCLGGLVGENVGDISNCYSIGPVTSGDNSEDLGGLVGRGRAPVANSFWDTQTSGQWESAGGTPKTTAQMQQASTFIRWNGCGQVIWTLADSNDYPRLLWEDKPGNPLPTEQFSDFFTGAGTENDPYLIHTAEEFNIIGLFPCASDKHFKLMADIDLRGFSGTEFNIIGRGRGFAGTFDGNGHRIINLTIDTGGVTTGYLGLFAKIGSSGQVRNLRLENVTVTAGYDSDCLGGLAAANYGTVSNCYSMGSVTGGDLSGDLGGLVGYNNGGTITNCYSTGSVTSGDSSRFLGGLVGENVGDISNCCSTAAVTGGENSSSLGGLVGDNEGTISNCFSTGAVTAVCDVAFLTGKLGGLVGDNGGTITNCYSTGSVDGGDPPPSVGGLVGYNNGGTISNSYSTGAVYGAYGGAPVGGLLGCHEKGTISNCFWDELTSMISWGVGIDDGRGILNLQGRTTAQMQHLRTFTDPPASWDFVGETANGTENIWRMCIDGVSYPLLSWQFTRGDLVCPDGVDFIDYSSFSYRWLRTDCADSNNCNGADLDFSGTVDWGDLKILCDHWLESTQP